MSIIIKKLKYIILTLILIIFILNIKIVINSTYEASLLFFKKVFITIFPFVILCDFLIYFNYHIFIKGIFGKIINKIFNIDSNTSIIFILSIFSSHPSNAIYIKNLLDNKIIDIKVANRILIYTYFPSIAFVIGVIGVSLYNSFKIGLMLWIICFINNILIGLFLRKDNVYIESINNESKNISFFECFKLSIIKAINTSFIILGNLIVFTIIINLIVNYISINPTILSVLTGFLELTSGVISISLLDIPFNVKFALTSLILNFSSLSILFQSFSILSSYKINIKKTLTIKLMFSIITFLLIIICT
ncbi:MAG: hypothetical protein MSH48_03700 [Mollicutes bacterium]|nr:hypothetical protein [Mollicutes bacterium]